MSEFVTLRDSLEDQGQQPRDVAPVANMAGRGNEHGQRPTWEMRDATTLAVTNRCASFVGAGLC